MLLAACKKEEPVQIKEEKLPFPRPEECTLDFWINENVDEVDFSGYTKGEDLSAFDFSGYSQLEKQKGDEKYIGSKYSTEALEDGGIAYPAACVEYTVSQNTNGNKVISKIEITDPEVSIYGISTNSSFNDFDKVFTGLGYRVRIAGEHGELYWVEKDGIKITFEENRIMLMVVEKNTETVTK